MHRKPIQPPAGKRGSRRFDRAAERRGSTRVAYCSHAARAEVDVAKLRQWALGGRTSVVPPRCGSPGRDRVAPRYSGFRRWLLRPPRRRIRDGRRSPRTASSSGSHTGFGIAHRFSVDSRQTVTSPMPSSGYGCASCSRRTQTGLDSPARTRTPTPRRDHGSGAEPTRSPPARRTAAR